MTRKEFESIVPAPVRHPITNRNVKGPLHRGEAILEYWIVNLIDEVIEVHRLDSAPVVSVARRGDVIVPVAFPNLSVPVVEILGPAEPTAPAA